LLFVIARQQVGSRLVTDPRWRGSQAKRGRHRALITNSMVLKRSAGGTGLLLRAACRPRFTAGQRQVHFRDRWLRWASGVRFIQGAEGFRADSWPGVPTWRPPVAATSFMIAVCERQHALSSSNCMLTYHKRRSWGALPARERRTALRTQSFPAKHPR